MLNVLIFFAVFKVADKLRKNKMGWLLQHQQTLYFQNLLKAIVPIDCGIWLLLGLYHSSFFLSNVLDSQMSWLNKKIKSFTFISDNWHYKCITNSMKLVIPLHLISWKKDSNWCCDATTPESIHTKDESKRGSAFAFIFGVNWPVQWM